MGLSDIVWVDSRSGSQAKTKTKHYYLLKLCNSNLLDKIYGILSVIGYEQVLLNKKNSKKFLNVTRL